MGEDFHCRKAVVQHRGMQSAHPYQINGLRTHLSHPQLKLQDKRRVCQIVIKVTFGVKRKYKEVTGQRTAARIGQSGGLTPGLAQLSDAPNQSG
jgi:hypothetical protein